MSADIKSYMESRLWWLEEYAADVEMVRAALASVGIMLTPMEAGFLWRWHCDHDRASSWCDPRSHADVLRELASWAPAPIDEEPA